jgi:uncharacterized membrane protein
MREAHTLEGVEPTRGADVTSGTPPSPPVPPGDLPRSISQEQLLYARILAAGMYTGLAVLLVTFVLYMSGAIAPAIPIDRLPDFWTMDVAQYLEAVNTQYLHHDHILTGWAWVSALEHGDYLNFVGIVVLSMVTIICFMGILPTLIRKRDYAYTVIAVLEIVILALAASGVLTAGGH